MTQIKRIKIGCNYYPLLPEGGTEGQVLKKQSNNDLDVGWGDETSGINLDTADVSGLADDGSTEYSLILVQNSEIPEEETYIPRTNPDMNTKGLYARAYKNGGVNLYSDLFFGNISIPEISLGAGKIIIGGNNNKGWTRNTTTTIADRETDTQVTNNHIVCSEALFKSNERYIHQTTDLTNLNAEYNVIFIETWWEDGNTKKLNFTNFPVNKHVTLFILGDSNEAKTDRTFTIPSTFSINSTEISHVFVNGILLSSEGEGLSVTVSGKGLLELDAYYFDNGQTGNGSRKTIIIRYA